MTNQFEAQEKIHERHRKQMRAAYGSLRKEPDADDARIVLDDWHYEPDNYAGEHMRLLPSLGLALFLSAVVLGGIYAAAWAVGRASGL